MYMYIVIYIKLIFQKRKFLAENFIIKLQYALVLLFSLLDGLQCISLYFSVTKYDLIVYIDLSTLPSSILPLLWNLRIIFCLSCQLNIQKLPNIMKHVHPLSAAAISKMLKDHTIYPAANQCWANMLLQLLSLHIEMRVCAQTKYVCIYVCGFRMHVILVFKF